MVVKKKKVVEEAVVEVVKEPKSTNKKAAASLNIDADKEQRIFIILNGENQEDKEFCDMIKSLKPYDFFVINYSDIANNIKPVQTSDVQSILDAIAQNRPVSPEKMRHLHKNRIVVPPMSREDFYQRATEQANTYREEHPKFKKAIIVRDIDIYKYLSK